MMPLPGRIELDEVPPSFRPFAAAILQQESADIGLIRLLGTLGSKVPRAEARDFALLLRKRLPHSSRLARVSDLFIREEYPVWYIRAVNDPHRNAAYRRAIETMVSRQSIVLEAGTGSGLFAMMAARAGATHVYTCEIDPHVAAIARENIERNQLSDRITLLACAYEELRLGVDLPRPADVFLHEFVASELLVPKMAKMAAGLRGRLLTTDAAILPHRFSTVGMLVGDRWPLDSIRVAEEVEGFDITAINHFASPGLSLPGPVPIQQPLSAPTIFAEFDLTTTIPPPAESRVIRIAATAAGKASGVLQWIRQSFPDGSVYENRPEIACNWWPIFWPFPDLVKVSRGGALPVRVACTETEIFIDLAEPSE